jgi:hypothetical protein
MSFAVGGAGTPWYHARSLVSVVVVQVLMANDAGARGVAADGGGCS